LGPWRKPASPPGQRGHPLTPNPKLGLEPPDPCREGTHLHVFRRTEGLGDPWRKPNRPPARGATPHFQSQVETGTARPCRESTHLRAFGRTEGLGTVAQARIARQLGGYPPHSQSQVETGTARPCREGTHLRAFGRTEGLGGPWRKPDRPLARGATPSSPIPSWDWNRPPLPGRHPSLRFRAD
jgi:hypothetical protein